MARRPDVFVRALSMDEGRKLAKVSRTAKDPVRLRRAIVVLMSGQGQTVKDISSLMQVSDDYVRGVIHAFNDRGFDALDPKRSGGRPPTIGKQICERICLIARTSPADWGITAFTTWSLSKLAEHLIARGTVVAISRETVRRILREGGVSWQTTTTWKASTDPDFIAKMHRILDLYDHPPADGRVICVDEFGPLNLMPRKGKAWHPLTKPRRLRATYNRNDGVMHMLAALDLATGPRQVTATWPHTDTLYQLVLADGTVIDTTEDHPFWNATDKQWQRADELDPGDQLASADGRAVTFGAVRPDSARDGAAFDLTVAGIHTYYVLAGSTPVMVHNCPAPASEFRRPRRIGLRRVHTARWEF